MEFSRHALASTQGHTVNARIEEWAAGAETFICNGLPVTFIDCMPDELQNVCKRLTSGLGYSFATLVVEEARSEWKLGYIFAEIRKTDWFGFP